MSERDRWPRGCFAFAVAVGLFGASTLVAQSTAAAPPRETTLAVWLQIVANITKVLELGAFVFSAYQFWAGRRERIAADAEEARRAVIDSNYQAWQVINSAQGKGGSGGRIEALGDLLRHGVSLAGIKLDEAWLEGVQLPRATLIRSSLRQAKLTGANLSGANLEGADLSDADLVGADLSGANLRGVNLTGARVSAANLGGADLTDVIGWRELSSISHTNIEGVRNPPAGFVPHALERGAVNLAYAGEVDDGEENYSRQFRTV